RGDASVRLMTRFVVCGEALIDLGGLPDGPAGHFASHWEAQAAGGPMTTAIALAQLGRDAQFLGRLSTDSFGRQIRAHLVDTGVGTDLAVTSDQATSVAVVSLDRDGRASYTFHFDQTANFDWQRGDLPRLITGDWLHVGSLALVVRPGAEVLREWAATTTGPMSIDVNVRPAVLSDPREYWHRIEPWLRLCGERHGLIKGSDEDFDFLADGAGVDSREKLIADLATSGASGVATTLGPDGARLELPDGSHRAVPGLRRDVVDTVGAGDTFMASLIDGQSRDLPVEQTLRRAVAASAIVVSRRGAQPPTAAEVDALVDSR
ncbi:MAG: carbohydrate kinase, partial [Propionibacteriales bacterium]|nr:carbohydrate kinase [Propionibacteriales bacterium]